MSDRRKPILKLICLGFAGVLVYQVAHLVATGNPVRQLAIPQVPSLPVAAETNAASGKIAGKIGNNGTNGTNIASVKGAVTNGTNSATAKSAVTNQVNSATGEGTTTNRTNSVTGQPLAQTNAALVTSSDDKATNTVPLEMADKPGTNLVVTNAITVKAAVDAKTNQLSNGTNAGISQTGGKDVKGTNALGAGQAGKEGTNSIGTNQVAKKSVNPGGRPDQPGKPPDLPVEIKGRVDRITQSEILGQVIHPQPMGLLGIAGQEAFLRATNGQTGPVKEGAEFAGMKLLRIGVNRVLVEVDGQKQELTMFSGLGGETLMPKEKEPSKTNEPPTKAKSP